MKYFIAIRLLDMATTVWGLNHGQYEFNPYNDWLIKQGWIYFFAFQFLMIWIISKIYKYRLIKFTVNIFTVINALVVLMNITIMLLVFLTEKGVIS